MPAKERRTGDSGGGDADQPLVCRRVLPKGVGESNQHGEIEGIHEGNNEKTIIRIGSEFGTALSRVARFAAVSSAMTTITQATTNPATPRLRCQPTRLAEIRPVCTTSRSIHVLNTAP